MEDRINRIYYTFYLIVICIVFSSGQAPRNVLLILVDDLGYGDLSLSGNPYLQTPYLDKLGKDGVRFDNFYVSSVCAPTRASLLTGKYHQRTGVQSVTNGYEALNPEEITLAEILKQNDYRTALFGKWHLGEYYPSIPNAQGFDYFLGFRTGHTDDYFNPTLEENGAKKKSAGYITDVLTDAALDFMGQQDSHPFFCYLAYNAPHTPLQIDSQYFMPFISQGLDERTARVYGMIVNLDENIGRLLSHMKEMDLEKNTLVIFMSDNGPISGWKVPQKEMRYNAGLRDQKFTVYEGGVRTQCFWYAPGYLLPTRVLEVGAHIDVLPTVLDIVDIQSDLLKDINGVSLLPAMFGRKSERVYFDQFDLSTVGTTNMTPGALVRRGPWKLVHNKELYNLELDPGEKNDLMAAQPEIITELSLMQTEWWENVLEDQNMTKKPIPVGYRESPLVLLQPHHARAEGNLKFEGKRGLTGERLGYHPSGVDGDWVVGWTEINDRLTWQVMVENSGLFVFTLIGDGWENNFEKIKVMVDEKTPLGIEESSRTLKNLNFSSQFMEKGAHQISIEMVQDGVEDSPILRALSIQLLP